MSTTLSIARTQKSHGPTVVHVQVLSGKDVVAVEVSLEALSRALTGEIGVERRVIRNTYAT